MFGLRIIANANATATAVVLLLLPSVIASGTQNPFLRSSAERLLQQQCLIDEAPIGDTPQCASVSSRAEDFDLCFGVRGNGPRLFAHFPALARAVEDFGVPSAYVGSSSATITGFLLESLLQNPLITDCGNGQCCTDMEQRARISFILKTFEAIGEDSFLNGLFILPETIVQRAKDRNILLRLISPIGTNKNEALLDLLNILLEPFGALKSTLVNPELIELLNSTSPNPILHAIDVLRATSNGFTVGSDPLVFLREYIINFRGIAWVVDFVASFWAGLEPTNLDELQLLLQECATVSNMGQEFSVISQQQTSVGENCGDFYMRLYGDYLRDRKAFETLLGEDTGFPSRLDLSIGETSLTTLIATSIATGDAMSTIKSGKEAYKQLNFNVNLDVNWEDGVFFGYYGPQQALDVVSSQLPILFTDAKSQRFFPLGPTTWREALTTSPAEPTLSNAVPSGTNVLSLGGWSDPVPGQVLRSLGCDRVVLINRPGGIGQFTIDIASLLGASDEQLDELFSLDDETSSLDVGLQVTDATFCADWDSPPISPPLLSEAGYDAPLLSFDGCIRSLGLDASGNETTGCTPLNPSLPQNTAVNGAGESSTDTSSASHVVMPIIHWIACLAATSLVAVAGWDFLS